MNLLKTFNNEMDAQLLGSQLKEAGIDYTVEEVDGGEAFNVMVYEDDVEEAKEILEAREFDDDAYLDGLDDENLDLDDFDDDDD